MPKNSGNYGSIRKLNHPEPKIEDKVSKSLTLTHEAAGDVSRKFGNPITRGGHTVLRPAVDLSGGPELYLGKAVRQAIKYGPGGAQFQRKRDPTGKFAPAQDAGAQSTAEEDQTDQQRDARLRHHRMLDQLHGEGNPRVGQSNAKKGMVPGVSESTTPDSSINDTNAQMIGSTMSGQPVYDDPFHSAHQQFTEQDHQEAADLHSQMSQQSQASGDAAGAAQHQSAAQAHMQQGQDQMAPGGRFMDNLFNQPGPPEVQPDDMSQFSDLLGMGQQQDQVAGNPAIAGGGVDPSMQDPMMGQPPVGPDPMLAQQPEPMAPSPIDAMMGQEEDPMAQAPAPATDPMAQAPDPSMQGGDSLAGFMDQGAPPEPGPAPGMQHSATGGPVGPQTDIAESSAGGIFDISDLGGGQDPMGEEDPMAMGEEDPMAMGEEDPMAMGEEGGESEEEFPPSGDDEKEQATLKAIAALRRYV